MLRFRYYEGANGRRFCVAIRPAFQCVLADPDPERPSGDVGSPWGLGIDEAAQAMECAPGDLAAVLKRAHASHAAGRRRDGDRLTNDCAICGRRMERLGFRAWVEEDVPPDEYTDAQASSARVASRIGGRGPTRFVGELEWFETKREALEWAREESRIHKAQVAEARS